MEITCINTKEGGATPKKEPNQKGSRGTPTKFIGIITKLFKNKQNSGGISEVSVDF